MIDWIIVPIALTGAALNIFKRREGFLFWIVSNWYWLGKNLYAGDWPQAIIFAMFLALSLYGLAIWTKPEKVESKEISDKAAEISDLQKRLQAAENIIEESRSRHEWSRKHRVKLLLNQAEMEVFLRRIMKAKPEANQRVKIKWLFVEAERLYVQITKKKSQKQG